VTSFADAAAANASWLAMMKATTLIFRFLFS
jgi:hypothetical protein